MALLAMTLMIGMIFYVYNVGDHANRRLSLQNAADAAAIGAGDWMARTMNLVAMNNCAQARMLALVPIFDAAPLAAEMSAEEITEWQRGLAAQLARGVPTTKNDFLRNGLETVRSGMAQQRDILAPFSAALNHPSFDMRLTTHWAVPGSGESPPHGSMWRTAAAMQEFSEVALGSLGVLTQANARRFARANRADVAFVLPVAPEIPAKIGEFQDFRPVLKEGMFVEGKFVSVFPEVGGVWPDYTCHYGAGNGGSVPDFADPHRLGPWATLYRWYGDVWESDGFAPGIRGNMGNVSGPWTPARTSFGGIHLHHVIGHRSYGPYQWAKDRIYDYWVSTLHYTRFYTHLAGLSNKKLAYMFDPVNQLSTQHYPAWKYVTDYDAAKGVAGSGKVSATLFYVMEVASSIAPSSSKWMTSGTYRTNEDEPVMYMPGRWWDPEIEMPAAVRVANYVWKLEQQYQTASDPDIGIHFRPVDPNDPDGPMQLQTVYLVTYFVWGGIDVGGDVEVRNPCNWDDYDELPQPVLYDPGDDGVSDYDPDNPDPDEGARREFFTLLGIAQDTTKTKVWPSQFHHINPLRAMAAVAQVKVFNNSSWDLWTQDWQVQLTPVSKWADWVDLAEAGQSELDMTDEEIDPDEYGRLVEYLYSITPEFAERYFKH
ncbi:hypothetical protein LCGC14_0302340 [marine sediment metagenome]|uniref:Uncharacterized protein n=1 Tax=marine sediment metagenome TaxID=412755 RepID=A0A0F9TPX5_9ZZZZ